MLSALKARLFLVLVVAAIPVLGLVVVDPHDSYSLAILVVTAGFIFALAWLVVDRSVVRPIMAISAGAARLGAGESGVRIGVSSGVQEIAALQRSFDAMAAALGERNARLIETGQQLQSAHDRLDAVIKASPGAIICLDRDCNVTLWNPAAERLFGWPATEVLGKKHPVVPPGEWLHFVTRFERTLAGESVIGARATRCKRDGQLVEVCFNSAPLHDAAGQRIGVLYVVDDLTVQMQTEKQLHQAQKMEVVGQLTGGIAHDFNNLLGVAIGNLDILAETAEAPEAQEYAQAALDACLKGAELTRQLLAFARRQPLRPEPIDPGETIRAIARLLERTLGDSVAVRLQVPDGLWPIVADPTQLEAAVINLAVNARDAMPDGGVLAIQVANASSEADAAVGGDEELRAGDYVQIAVSDSGTGMLPEVAARAFEPFFTTKETGKGTGLGLSMVYGFIKQSGGHIQIDSAPGHGTTIKLWLPRDPSGVMAAIGPARPPAPLLHGTERVLVVEDNAEIRKMAVRQLTELGYQVEEASNGPGALEILRRRDDIDLLFTDIVMPGGLDGYGLAREAQALRPTLRTLFTSGFHSSHGAEPREGPLLSKPYRKPQLAEALRAALRA